MPVNEKTEAEIIEELKDQNAALCRRIDQLEAASNVARELTPITKVVSKSDGTSEDVLTGREVYTSDTPWVYSESIWFKEDSGYDMNFPARAHAIVDRALGFNATERWPVRCGSHGGKSFIFDKLPPFASENRLKVTVEFIAHSGE